MRKCSCPFHVLPYNRSGDSTNLCAPKCPCHPALAFCGKGGKGKKGHSYPCNICIHLWHSPNRLATFPETTLLSGNLTIWICIDLPSCAFYWKPLGWVPSSVWWSFFPSKRHRLAVLQVLRLLICCSNHCKRRGLVLPSAAAHHEDFPTTDCHWLSHFIDKVRCQMKHRVESNGCQHLGVFLG